MSLLNGRHITLSFLVTLFCSASALSVAFYAVTRKEVKPQGMEKRIAATVEAALGDLTISGGAPEGTIAVVQDANPSDDLSSMIRYRVNGETGLFSFSTDKTEGILHREHFASFKAHETCPHVVLRSVSLDPDPAPAERRAWSVQFSKQYPLSLTTEVGLGNSIIDMTDIPVENLSVNAGASKVFIRCDKKNPLRAHTLNFNVGASKLSTENLSNLNFDRLHFDGGLGAYTLDFGGDADHDALADIDIGMGTLVIVMPRTIGAIISYDDNWFSSYQLDDCHRTSKGEYASNNAERVHSKIHFRIDAGAGSVRLKWK